VSCFNLSFLDVPLILCFRICSSRYLELFEKAKAAGAVPCLIRNCEIANGIFEVHIAKHLQELALSSISASNVEEDPLTDPPIQDKKLLPRTRSCLLPEEEIIAL
jgi:hypothetical protein